MAKNIKLPSGDTALAIASVDPLTGLLVNAPPVVEQRSTVLFAGNAATGGGEPHLMNQSNKVIQCVIPSGFSSVQLDAEGSNDGATWVQLASFSASGAVINTDPYRFLRGNGVATTGAGASTVAPTVTRYTSAAPITGSTLSANELAFYLDNGYIWKFTSTAHAIGDWILAIGGGDWNGKALPIIDEGSTETLLYDHGGQFTSTLTDTALTIISSIMSLTVGQ